MAIKKRLYFNAAKRKPKRCSGHVCEQLANSNGYGNIESAYENKRGKNLSTFNKFFLSASHDPRNPIRLISFFP